MQLTCGQTDTTRDAEFASGLWKWPVLWHMETFGTARHASAHDARLQA